MSGMDLIQRFLKQTKGAVLPMAALLFPVIFGAASLGVDLSNSMLQRRDLQTASDAAALAAAYEYMNGSTETAVVTTTAIREAQANGFDPAAGAIEVNIYTPDIEANVGNGGTLVQVTVTAQSTSWFRNFISGEDSVNVVTVSVAEAGGDDNDSFCMLSLDPDANKAITTSGNVTIDATGCGIAVNSTSDSALSVNGNVDIDIGDLNIAGNMEIIGASASVEYDDLDINAPQVEDPYADLEVPEFDACSRNDIRDAPSNYNSASPLSPGVYCGGITLTGNNDIVFNPGVYILDGGDFDVSGSGSLYGEGVTFILTNSGEGSDASLDISGDREVFFSAPEVGEQDTAGIVFYQDRNMEESNRNTNTLTGNSELQIEGVAYFPNNEINYGGNTDSSSLAESPCSLIIGKTIVLHGNPVIGNNCSETSGVTPISGPDGVRLVL